MPVVVDPKRFEEKTAKSEERYVAYCGSMNSPKDGIDTLLESFALFTSAFPDIQLKLIGRTDFSDFARLKKKLSDLSLNDRVQFTGRVTNEEMAMLLKNAVMLVLARPDSVQAKANFPTKIGEYCATGKPIVTTRVGSITDFFSDGINIFLAEPDNPISFSTKMREVMNNYPSALNIGEEGRKLASTVLNYNYQGKRLSDFVFSLHHD
jgi:glycosyltransferase involved in cell wall biosynthesis